jgi:hypothetical protein
MSFRRFIVATTVALALALSMNIAAGTANACDVGTTGGYCLDPK